MRSKNKIKIVIIGASGLIGNNLYNYLKKKKYHVIGTYFQNKKKNLIFFDIKKNNISFLKKIKDINYLIISHGINVNLDETKKNYKRSYYVNFLKIKKIIDFCSRKKVIPVYISSDAVFDGKKGNLKESDSKKPINSYGKIKDKVENYIIKKKIKYLIIRVSKVFSEDITDNTLITGLLKKMKLSNRIHCAYDQKFSPIFISDMSLYIEKLLKKECFGIYHLSSIKSVNILSLAKKIKNFFHIKNIKIIPKKINSFKLIEKKPLLNTLSTNKFNKVCNIKNFELEYFLKKIKKNKKNYHYFKS